MIIQSNYVIFLHKHVESVKCDLLELESTQKHFWLIFNNCLKLEKALPCYFCHINSTTNFGLRPVGLDRSFHKLSKNIKFIKFGSVDLKLFNFEKASASKFDLKRKFEI